MYTSSALTFLAVIIPSEIKILINLIFFSVLKFHFLSISSTFLFYKRCFLQKLFVLTIFNSLLLNTLNNISLSVHLQNGHLQFALSETLPNF